MFSMTVCRVFWECVALQKISSGEERGAKGVRAREGKGAGANREKYKIILSLRDRRYSFFKIL